MRHAVPLCCPGPPLVLFRREPIGHADFRGLQATVCGRANATGRVTRMSSSGLWRRAAIFDKRDLHARWRGEFRYETVPYGNAGNTLLAMASRYRLYRQYKEGASDDRNGYHTAGRRIADHPRG